MNVLPLVSSFLLIFAMCSYAFVHSMRSSCEEQIHFAATKRIHQKYQNECAKKAYRKIKGKNLHSPNQENTAEKIKDVVFASPRDQINKRPESKLFLSLLLSDDEQSKAVEDIALNLLEKLYFFAPFYEEGLEKRILSTLMTTWKNYHKCQSFEDLLPHIPSEERPLFYKIIKGTQTYKVSTTIGYPPLEDFFSLEQRKNGLAVHFTCASRPLLEALFDPQLASVIIMEEKHKWESQKHKHSPLSKQELESLLLSYRKNPGDYDSLLSFSSTKHTPAHTVIKDPEAKIQLKFLR